MSLPTLTYQNMTIFNSFRRRAWDSLLEPISSAALKVRGRRRKQDCRTLQDRLGRAVSPAIVYPFLSGLVGSGYASSRRERDGGRTRAVYKLTPSGRRFSERVFKRLSTIMSVAISPNASACANCGCRLLEPGHLEDIGGQRLTFCCVHCAAAYRRGDSDT